MVCQLGKFCKITWINKCMWSLMNWILNKFDVHYLQRMKSLLSKWLSFGNTERQWLPTNYMLDMAMTKMIGKLEKWVTLLSPCVVLYTRHFNYDNKRQLCFCYRDRVSKFGYLLSAYFKSQFVCFCLFAVCLGFFCIGI